MLQEILVRGGVKKGPHPSGGVWIFSGITQCVTKKFLEVSHCSHPKQQKRNVQKKGAACAKLLF